jgi:hypothetical protein
MKISEFFQNLWHLEEATGTDIRIVPRQDCVVLIVSKDGRSLHLRMDFFSIDADPVLALNHVVAQVCAATMKDN